MRKRGLLIVGVLLLLLGIASLFVPIPMRERHGIEAGPVSFGVEVRKRERVHPGISAALIAGGVGLLALSARRS
jgi:hypothetical protein